MIKLLAVLFLAFMATAIGDDTHTAKFLKSSRIETIKTTQVEKETIIKVQALTAPLNTPQAVQPTAEPVTPVPAPIPVSELTSIPAPTYVAPTPLDKSSAKIQIYLHESGNLPWKINTSSGACGLGQALPCSKLPCGLNDYACQDSWFTTNYMVPRYSTWDNAWAYWNCIGYCTNNYGTILKKSTWW